jgi:hypothetical protein
MKKAVVIQSLSCHGSNHNCGLTGKVEVILQQKFST